VFLQTWTISRTVLPRADGIAIRMSLMPSWLLRAEYRYADLGTKTFTDIRVTSAGPTTQLATYSLGVTTHTAFVGLAYKF
jgi:outer membrane immunogenic protein